ncbi:MAG: ring-cleaving dioxygenase [Fimbriimonas sp.]|nr:ring-cleaving dioxygenase [Fimbriimonas sp.]
MAAQTLHHVTAVTAQIERNLKFYTETLGLRLVKKSVNQDDVSAYHLFYADAVGSPGTDMTFFDWPMIGSAVPGPGTVAVTSFKVPGESLEWWEARLLEADAYPELAPDEFDRSRIQFTDPEGQRLELVDDTGLAGQSTPWSAHVPPEWAIRGFFGVELDSARPLMTQRVLVELLGYRPLIGSDDTFAAQDEGSYSQIKINHPDARRVGRVGAGGVHHVAFRVSDDEELLALKAKIEAAGIQTSGYIDRFYFHSVYFREPGGVLFELATDGPGFASDESAETLGQHLALPPFLEDRRAEIEAGLKPL